ncbi:chromosome transmission fidelity protein 18 homolog [Xenia sp. Carnegie-2017]|uniref:chromosome transmission fidelity protein 18 homolog n=1 Tax=Xenia sp. Carnegie-2017 TaxID=2897299 RepID=UPI001F04CC88|nr:chromosome transmission fidelity protein 18 homolog [Xenia sp. Carnegie-2017]
MEEDWEALAYEDDFERRYADELELLNEMEEEENIKTRNPSHYTSRKTLVFATPDKSSKVSLENPNQYKRDITRGFKRQIDKMYDLLSNEEDSDDALNSNDHILNSSENKRVRLDLNTVSTIDSANRTFNENESYRSTTHSVNARPKVFARPLIGEDCVSVTGTDGGRRVYLHIKREESKEMVKAKFLDGKTPVNLLGVPFSVLRETIYEEKRLKLLEESRKLTETLNNVLTDELTGNNVEMIAKEQVPEKEQMKSLWVDKYSPRSYIELLSDDGINRNLLTWLKLWDGAVFGKENVKTRRKHAEKIQKKENKRKHFNYKEEHDEAMELDVTGRPSHKIALLCGPPGLGKTTLAHIVAQHAGYNVVEMNASDDRSVEVFRNKIESTTQMQSVLDSGKRPNCLVIDEIDGAPTPAINVLLSLIKKKDADLQKASNDDNTQKKRKKRHKHVILSRPIICICNDPYVPALRQLRQLAFVLTFPPTMSGRLAQRLLEVSRKELFQTDMSTLLALCEKTENDIRSCLNTLQFLRQRGKVLSIEYIQSENIGLKDSQKSLFSLWKAVFQLPRAKNKRLATLIEPLNEPSPMLPEFGSDDPTRASGLKNSAATFYNLLHLVSSNGQYNKLENGIFENYLSMKFKDSYLNQVVMATEWLQFADLISHYLHEHQSFIMMRYQPFLPVLFHTLFAAPTQPKINYPRLAYENSLKEARIRNIITSLLCDVSPPVRGGLDVRKISVEVLPLLLHIITPTLRPINMQLFSSDEKQQMRDLINTMITYNINYLQERNIEGQYSYIFDPKIEEAVKFPGLPQHKQLTYAMKQLIAREVGLEKMRITEKMVFRKSRNEEKGKDCKKEKIEKESESLSASDCQSASVVLHLKPKELKLKKQEQAKDFFGRAIITNELSDDESPTDSTNSHSPFWFKFQEGFSNAVRRPVKIQDLL